MYGRSVESNHQLSISGTANLVAYAEFKSSQLADAVAVEPVSAPKFPANREINREFFNFGPTRGSEDS